jgi:flagellar motor component MotA
MRTVYFDLDALYIKVELQANSATDEQSRLNVNINAVDKLGMSREMAWERMGWRSFKLAQQQRIQETLLESELQNEVMRNNQQVIEEMRQQVMQEMQQQMSQAAQTSQMNGGEQPTMEGVDNRAGGNPFAMANPSGTRESLTGQDAGGGQVMQ